MDDFQELVDKAISIAVNDGKCSTSFLQRKLRIGYARAASIVDILEDNGVVGEADGTKPREVLIDSPINVIATVEQFENSKITEGEKRKYDWLRPHQFSPGQSGNPKGRPKGPSLKEWAKKMLNEMNNEERIQFVRGLDKKTIWEMAEGKPRLSHVTEDEEGNILPLNQVEGTVDKILEDD